MSLSSNSLSLSTHNLFAFRLDLFTISIKAFRTILAFLSFKGLTHAYVMKTSMTHNKFLTFLFFEGNDSISAKSACQILSLNLAYAFLLLDFLITGLDNCVASCSFTLIPEPLFLSKN